MRFENKCDCGRMKVVGAIACSNCYATARDRREAGRQAMWECYHYSVNRQDRKLTIRNIIGFGFTAKQAIEYVKDCEHED